MESCISLSLSKLILTKIKIGPRSNLVTSPAFGNYSFQLFMLLLLLLFDKDKFNPGSTFRNFSILMDIILTKFVTSNIHSEKKAIKLCNTLCVLRNSKIHLTVFNIIESAIGKNRAYSAC